MSYNYRALKIDMNKITDTESIIIITSHAENDEKKKMLVECIESIKNKFDLKIILSSNIEVPSHIQKMCDYVLIDKENPILYNNEYETYGLNYYIWSTIENEKVYHQVKFEYGYAVYVLARNAVSLALGLGYKKVHILDYDYELNEDIFIENSKFLDEYDLVAYKFPQYVYGSESYLFAFFSAKVFEIHKLLNLYKSKQEYYSNVVTKNSELLEKYFYYMANDISKMNIKEREVSYLESVVSNINKSYKLSSFIRYWKFHKTRNKFVFCFNKNIKASSLILREKSTQQICFTWGLSEFFAGIEYFLIPSFPSNFDLSFLSGFILEIYQNDNLIHSKELPITGDVSVEIFKTT